MKEVATIDTQVLGKMQVNSENLALNKLKTISVPVDLSEVSANAMRFAWKMAQELNLNMEAVFAMDSIFEGTSPSASGFLSGYQVTMKNELDGFVADVLNGIGVQYDPPSRIPGAPGTIEHPHPKPVISSKVIYGAPDLALTEYSRFADFMIMGTTGRGGVGKKIFGSVSIEVSKNCHCPVIFVPKEAEYRGFQQVLYASDFDSLDAQSVEKAVRFTEQFKGQIHFVHVGPGGEKGLERMRQIFEAEYGEINPDHPFVFRKMVSDDIAGALYEYAFYHRIGLLVFVTHQRNFWENILHKSITNVALLSSDLPLLIMHSESENH
jgi:nucleotide-binding universal stress UspA family protein